MKRLNWACAVKNIIYLVKDFLCLKQTTLYNAKLPEKQYAYVIRVGKTSGIWCKLAVDFITTLVKTGSHLPRRN